MKYILFLVITLYSLDSFSQGRLDEVPRRVSFIAKIDLARATKDGIYLNGYVVNIPYEKASQLNGKMVRVKGKVTVVKGLDNQKREYTENGEEIIKQGRSGDTRHILFPKIKVVG